MTKSAYQELLARAIPKLVVRLHLLGNATTVPKG
jgi:hypothetical protein